MLRNFSITSFRGIDRLNLSLGERTYIQGANGSWKTHVLDAIHLLSGSHPLYGNSTMDVGCVFEGVFIQDELSKNYKLLQEDKRSFFAVQGSKVTKPKYMSALPWRTVYISPFDMNLLYFAPNMRRDAMDLTLSRVYEQFSKVKKDYELVMRQRNALLKKVRDGEAQSDELDFWDNKFALLAETYWLYRSRYVHYIQGTLSRFPSFFSRYRVEFQYISSIQVEREHAWLSEDATDGDIVRYYLEKNRQRDILIGHTHIWPHRDDWGFFMQKDGESIAVQEYLSRWEMKMLLLGLKIVETEFITETLKIPVIMLIDDIFAELDENNSEVFLNSLTTYQVVLTSQKPLPNHEKHHDFICINLEYS
jgi:DNA replication and repair protein RecF